MTVSLLGQGRPYEPEERLVRYLLGIVEQRIGARDRARAAFVAVVDATAGPVAAADRLDLVVIPVLAALGRSSELRDLWVDVTSDAGRVGSELIDSVERAGRLREVVPGLAAEHTELFGDLDGRMLLRALLAADAQGDALLAHGGGGE